MLSLDTLGINGAVIIAGFSGGVCFLAAPIADGSKEPPRLQPKVIVSALITSTLTANYVTAAASKYLGAPELISAFVVGFSATWILKAIVRRAKSLDLPGRSNGSNGSNESNGSQSGSGK
jgi:hypothetical protein